MPTTAVVKSCRRRELNEVQSAHPRRPLVDAVSPCVERIECDRLAWVLRENARSAWSLLFHMGLPNPAIDKIPLQSDYAASD